MGVAVYRNSLSRIGASNVKVKVKKAFQYQVDSRTIKTLEVGVHDLPVELAQKVLRFGKAELVKVPKVEKKAPENKVVKTPETKEGRSSSAGSKPGVRGSRSK